MKVLVTGGTGFLGERLCRALAERGDEVTVLSRRSGKSKHATQVVWTPEEAGPWLDEVKKADAVVHLAGAGIMDKRWTDEHLKACRDSRVIPTRIVAETLAARTDKPKAFVSASAVGYYGFLEDDRPCDESAPPGSDLLAEMCAAWEASSTPARAAGIRTVNLRIGIVLGPDGGALAQMLPIFKLGIGGPLGSGRQMFPWIHVGDAIAAILFALDTPSLEGPVNITAPKPVPMKEFASALGRALHRPALLPVPKLALRIAVGRGADVVLTGQNAVPKKLLGAGFAHRHPDLDEALSDLVGG